MATVPSFVPPMVHRLLAGLAAVVLGTSLLTAGAPRALSEATDVESFLAARVDQARAEQGIPRLDTRPALVAVARDWADRMARQGQAEPQPRPRDPGQDLAVGR